MPRPRTAALLAAVLAALLAVPPTGSSAQSAPAYGTTRLFAAVPAPGHADTGLVLDDGTVLVSTNRGAAGSTGPSRLFRYSPTGRLLRTYVVRGQVLDGDHGTMGMALDAQGRLYVADYAPARVLRFALRTGAQTTYATLPDLPLCTGATTPCDNGLPVGPRTDPAPWPDGLAFLPDGRLLVTDLGQGTVFAVPDGGGAGRVWLQGPELRSTFGPNQPVLTPQGDLLLDVTASTMPATAGRGVLYRVPVVGGRPGTPRQVYATAPGEGPDGFALGRSGRVYVPMLVTDRVAVVAPDGREVASFADPRLDAPSSVTFLGTDALVTNLTYFTNDKARDEVLRITVGDRGVPAVRPRVRR